MALKHAGAIKRMGARYGRKIRHKLSEVEAEQRKKHKCPYCHAASVKRVAAGIWLCQKCQSKFTNRAYTVTAPVIKEEELEKQPEAAEEEEEDYEEDQND